MMLQPLDYQNKKKRMTLRVFGVLGLCILAFIGTKLYPLVHGPSLHLETNLNEAHRENPLVHLSGKASHTQDLLINGLPLELDPDGTFSEDILLNQGYNTLVFAAKDRYGTVNEVIYPLVLTENNSSVVTLR